MKMKKIFIFTLLVLPIYNFGQTLEELYNDLINKDKPKQNIVYYKSILNEIVTLNSTSNEYWSGGNSKSALYVKLPLGTVKWHYRITLMDVRQNYFYNTNETLYSLLSNNHPLFVNNQTSLGINFYIINDYALNDFNEDRNFNRYLDYQNENTRGFTGICNLRYNNLMICLKNSNLKDGLKAIVEVVAYGSF
jgi:hypothetical protein